MKDITPDDGKALLISKQLRAIVILPQGSKGRLMEGEYCGYDIRLIFSDGTKLSISGCHDCTPDIKEV